MLETLSGEKWKRIGTAKRSGILAPLFSVYSKNSTGIADLEDLKLLIDLGDKTANSIIQLLPMNEVGPDFCPYDSISSFALEPMYLSIEKLYAQKDGPIQDKIEKLKKNFPAGKPHVNYAVKNAKVDLLREIYLKNKDSVSREYQDFQKENSFWLENFALFKTLKNFHHGLPWYEWAQEYKSRQDSAIKDFKKKHKDEIGFHAWVQWQLYRQFKEARDYAHKMKVFLKGDLPIFVSRDSADVWRHPEFFKLEFASGAPPDMYCAKGQRWGTPTYNWERIASDGYRYLKEKLKYAQNFYDILRIDHVVGLFRIWSIPVNEPEINQGLNGFFDPSDEGKWEEHGRRILSVILESTNMLICAEDLGTIPACCPRVLAEFGILGNEVQRWVKDWNKRHDFLEPNEYRRLSVTMLSTHDTTNWPAWWENEAGTVDEALFIRKSSDHRNIGFERVKYKLFDLSCSRHGRLRWLESVDSIDKLVSILEKSREEVGDFIDLYENTFREKEKLWRHLKLSGQVREKCDPEIVKAVLRVTLESQAVFCINTLIDWLYLSDIFSGDAYQYRTNIPGTVGDRNWSQVLPQPLEEMLKSRVCEEIKDMITHSGRHG